MSKMDEVFDLVARGKSKLIEQRYRKPWMREMRHQMFLTI